jgi:Ca2+-transporting ATPase
MMVDKLWISGEVVEMTGNNGDILKKKISEEVLNILLQALFQNNASEMVKDKQGKITVLGTPTDSALLEFGLLLGGDFDVQCRLYKKLKTEPFNPVQKKMSALVGLPNGGQRVFCKGASEIILKMCDKIIDCNGVPVAFLENHAKKLNHIINAFATETLRTICIAIKDVNAIPTEASIPDNGYTLIAVVGINDPIRLGVKDVVQTCLAAGVTIAMVTGDDMNVARTIATECGILTNSDSSHSTIEGQRFRNLSTWEMEDIIPSIQVLPTLLILCLSHLFEMPVCVKCLILMQVMARFVPHDKYSIVANLKKVFGKVVAVTSDGISDAPALHEADIGVAMGLSGSEVFFFIS